MTDNDKNSRPDMKKVKIEVLRAEDFKQTYSIGALGGHSPYDFRIGFYNDSPKGFDRDSNSQLVQRILETEVILSPLAALELHRWLEQHIKDYENMFGPIAKINKKQMKKAEPSKDTSDIQGYI